MYSSDIMQCDDGNKRIQQGKARTSSEKQFEYAEYHRKMWLYDRYIRNRGYGISIWRHQFEVSGALANIRRLT